MIRNNEINCKTWNKSLKAGAITPKEGGSLWPFGTPQNKGVGYIKNAKWPPDTFFMCQNLF